MSTDGFGKQQSVARLDATAIMALIDAHFPHLHSERTLQIEEVTGRTARVRMKYHPRNVRPGGTISGPAMFTLADMAIWTAIMAAMGEAGVDAVTTHLNFNFLNKPAPRDMLCEVKLLRISKRSAVAECMLYSEGDPEVAAHAVGGYAIPSSPEGKIAP